jgi:glycosyltransferase involved in cell wall biosynthesis
LIEALGLLHAAGYANVRLRIAGIAPSGPGTKFFTSRARRHGVLQSIDWLGRLDAEHIVAELLRAAVFAYPSHIDNSPNALCEALLLGVPTVATYVGGVPSLIEDRHDGFLYPDGDPYALAGRIRDLMDDASLAAELGRRARERALRRHDPGTIVSSLMRIYSEQVS